MIYCTVFCERLLCRLILELLGLLFRRKRVRICFDSADVRRKRGCLYCHGASHVLLSSPSFVLPDPSNAARVQSRPLGDAPTAAAARSAVEAQRQRRAVDSSTAKSVAKEGDTIFGSVAVGEGIVAFRTSHERRLA